MRVDVSGRTFSFPRHCACCGGAPDSFLQATASRTTGVKVVRTRTQTWRFPYCSRCIRHVSVLRSATTWCLVSLGVGLLLATLLDQAVHSTVFASISGFVAVGGAIWAFVWRHRLARSMQCPTCTAPGATVSYLGWDGTFHRFTIMSRAYATEFMWSNRDKLLNLTPEHFQLLENKQRTVHGALEAQLDDARQRRDAEMARLAMANEAQRAASEGAREDAEFLRWVTKLESLKGPSSRKAALENGLASLTTEDKRMRLRLEASKIEARAAIEKAESMKSVPARLRHLEASLEALRSDTIDDALQADEIRELEAAIWELKQG